MLKKAAVITAVFMVFSFAGCSSGNGEQNIFSSTRPDTSDPSFSQTENSQSGNPSETDKTDESLSETDKVSSSTESSSAGTGSQDTSSPARQPSGVSSGAASIPSGTVSASSEESSDNSGDSHSSSSDTSDTDNGSSDSQNSKPSQSTDKHTHNFVDVGVQAMDWSGSPEPGYSGPTNTMESVSATNACLGCGLFFGRDSDKFMIRYYDHIWGPNASGCGGSYTAATIYACYHLLSCSDPDCHCYRRGDFAYYEYTVYLKGNNNPGKLFILEDWQIEELGLPKH